MFYGLEARGVCDRNVYAWFSGKDKTETAKEQLRWDKPKQRNRIGRTEKSVPVVKQQDALPA
jgi:hypothetical protein